jgi:succinate dehydrogenase/fumarate reductase flavoprotein subunit
MADLGVEGPAQLAGGLELESLLSVAEIMARAALLRTESRGSHYREDYPQRDDRTWEKSIITRHVDGCMEQSTLRLPRAGAGSPERLQQSSEHLAAGGMDSG